MPLTAQTMAQATHGVLARGAADAAFEAVFTDTRQPRDGGLFVALVGERYDGHKFLADAVARGAAGVLISDRAALDSMPADVVGIVVDDTLAGLQALAAHVRAAHTGRVVAITGSVGKTTLKDMVAAAVSDGRRVASTPGNWNNHIGLPLTLLSTTGDEDLLVVELGMSAPGEIDALTRLARPDVGVVTGAVAAHLEFFDSVDAIADAKAELFAALPPTSDAVVNADDPRMLARARAATRGRLTTYGRADDADVRLLDARLEASGLRATVDVAGTTVTVGLRALGAHNAHNAAGALAVAHTLGVDPARAAADLGAGFAPGAHRLTLVDAARGMTVLDDSYNANPASTHAALDTLVAVAPAGATLGAVLGTMRELGPTSDALHRAAGAHAAKAGLCWLAATGAHADAVAEGARAAGLSNVLVAADAIDLSDAVADLADANVWLLLKGSRGERLERLLVAVTGEESR